MILDPIKPYLLAIKYGLIVALLLGVGVAGCRHGAAKQLEKDTKVLVKKDAALNKAAAALTQAYVALTSAGTLLDAVNAEANRRIAADAQALRENAAAAKTVVGLKQAMDKQNRDFAKKLKHARQNPDCDALARMDLEAICGI